MTQIDAKGHADGFALPERKVFKLALAFAGRTTVKAVFQGARLSQGG
jgi:hypothetical protein